MITSQSSARRGRAQWRAGHQRRDRVGLDLGPCIGCGSSRRRSASPAGRARSCRRRRSCRAGLAGTTAHAARPVEHAREGVRRHGAGAAGEVDPLPSCRRTRRASAAAGRRRCERGRGGEACEPLDRDPRDLAHRAVAVLGEVRAADAEAGRALIRGAAEHERRPLPFTFVAPAASTRRPPARCAAWNSARSSAAAAGGVEDDVVRDHARAVGRSASIICASQMRGERDLPELRSRRLGSSIADDRRPPATAARRRAPGSARRSSSARGCGPCCVPDRVARARPPAGPRPPSPPPGRSAVDADESPLDRPLGELRALLVLGQPGDAEQLVHRAQVGLDGVEAEVELVADLLVGRGRGQSAASRRRAAERGQDLALGVRQLVDRDPDLRRAGRRRRRRAGCGTGSRSRRRAARRRR